MNDGLRVALDLTPLVGPPTGIHQATAGLLQELVVRPGIAPHGYLLSTRARTPAGLDISVRSSRVPAALCHRTWARVDWPSARWIAGRCDVVHGTNFTVPPDHPARVVTVQDLGLVTNPEWCTPAVARMAGALRRSVQQGAHVHVTSAMSAEQAHALLAADHERLHVIPVGVNAVGPGDPERARRAVGAERYVLALGTTEPRKGLVGLIDAAAALPTEVRIVVAGPEGPAEGSVISAARGHGLGDRFVRLPDVDPGLRADLLRGASALAYPSLAEGFGLPPLEAVSIGTPVAATRVGALPELIGSEIDLVEPGDVAELTAVLRAIVDTPPPPAAAAQRRIAELSWDRVTDRMVELYHRAAGA